MTETTRRDILVRRIILLEGLANLIVLLAKLTVGLTTGSLAVLGDAVHSLTDVTNNAVAWVVIKLSSQPPDREHPYGNPGGLRAGDAAHGAGCRIGVARHQAWCGGAAA